MTKVCSVPECENKPRGVMCTMHSQRLRKTGTTDPGPKAHAPIADRFWQKVKKTDDGSCWEWVGYKMPNGYGRISVGAKKEGGVSAHRFSCELHHGPMPFDGAHVMHICDNRGCVNPDHLRWCTPSENIQDAYDKKRKVSPWSNGNHPFAKLTTEKVLRARNNPQIPGAVMAQELGCSKSTVSAIRLGKIWKNVRSTECP